LPTNNSGCGATLVDSVKLLLVKYKGVDHELGGKKPWRRAKAGKKCWERRRNYVAQVARSPMNKSMTPGALCPDE